MFLKHKNMKAQKAHENFELMQEFRESMRDFLEARKAIHKVERERDDRFTDSYADKQAFESRIQSLQSRYQTARTKVARRIAEATEICETLSVPTVLTISAPPMFGGGPAGSGNVFQAVITENLPFDAQVAPQSVIDLIDQAIFACERVIAKQGGSSRKARLPASERPTAEATITDPADTESSSPIKGKIWNAVIDSLVKHIVGSVMTGVFVLVTFIYYYFFS